MLFRSISSQRRSLACAAAVMALFASGCKRLKDKIDAKLYTEVDQTGWQRDSALINSDPPVLFTVLRKGQTEYLMPIAFLGKGTPSTLRFVTKRGWSAFDIKFLFQGSSVTPIADGHTLPPVKTTRGMWEVPSAPNDSLVCSGALLPLGQVSLPKGTELAVANYKVAGLMRVLSPGELEDAIKQVPLLVMPTVQISASQLGEYTRSVHQIPRVGADPAVLIEYHDERPLTDTSVVGQRRPRHVLIILEKGVYNYRPTWQYTTTGSKTDRSILRFLDILDVNMDGRSEVFLYSDAGRGLRWVLAYQEWNDTWREFWRRSPARCEQ